LLLSGGGGGAGLERNQDEGGARAEEVDDAALRTGDLDTARRIYRWFMPLLHLDSEHDLVQSIKLAEQIMGRGSERVRPPRLPLSGERRAAVIAMVENARDSRP